ncbi:MAG: hypothetical protein NTV22_11840, partial [bacterium]|nr:hypothetical protein [bacterium]
MKHDNLKRTVYHEAGHAVMDVLLGLPFVKVSIEMKQKEGYQVEQGRAQRMTYYYTDGVVWNAAHTDAVN